MRTFVLCGAKTGEEVARVVVDEETGKRTPAKLTARRRVSDVYELMSNGTLRTVVVSDDALLPNDAAELLLDTLRARGEIPQATSFLSEWESVIKQIAFRNEPPAAVNQPSDEAEFTVSRQIVVTLRDTGDSQLLTRRFEAVTALLTSRGLRFTSTLQGDRHTTIRCPHVPGLMVELHALLSGTQDVAGSE